MKARPKVNHSYLNNMPQRQSKPSTNGAGVASTGAGKMTAFKSLDDIPDMTDDYNPPIKDSTNSSYYIQSNTSSITQSKIPSISYSQPRSNMNDIQEEDDEEDDYDYNQNNNYNSYANKPPSNVPPNYTNNNYNSSNIQISQSKYLNNNYQNDSNNDNCNNNNHNNYNYQTSNILPPSLPCEIITKKSKSESEKESLYYSKQPRPVKFKPYTLDQYNLIKPKEYIEIANIKPDLNTDELVAKRANMNRIKDFSNNLKSFNQVTLRNQQKLPAANEQNDMEIAKKKMDSKRLKAIEFAKNIPKPKIKNNKNNLNNNNMNNDDDNNYGNDYGDYGMDEDDHDNQ
eukprot:gene14997-20174_t